MRCKQFICAEEKRYSEPEGYGKASGNLRGGNITPVLLGAAAHWTGFLQAATMLYCKALSGRDGHGQLEQPCQTHIQRLDQTSC